jgi:hypothetical protein
MRLRFRDHRFGYRLGYDHGRRSAHLPRLLDHYDILWFRSGLLYGGLDRPLYGPLFDGVS